MTRTNSKISLYTFAPLRFCAFALTNKRTNMHIALTYDLRSDYEKLGFSGETIAEFDSVQTINAIDSALTSLGYKTERVGNIWRLTEKLAASERWDMVFNIAEGLHGMAREAQVPALLDAYQIPYVFSEPDILVICHNKALAKQIVAAAGVPTAQYTVVKNLSDIENIAMAYPLFAKPIAEGTGKGVSEKSLVKNKAQLRATCQQLLEQFGQPVLVEDYLSGREFTVGITGTGAAAKIVGVLEVILKDGAESAGHTYHNKENCEELIDYVLCNDATAQKAAEVTLAAWQALGCRDGGRIDIRCDEAGLPHFIEVNPLAGLHPVRSDLTILASQAGVSYNELIGRIMDSASQRVEKREVIYDIV
jgi:D-alanine-D-alanine ligase